MPHSPRVLRRPAVAARLRHRLLRHRRPPRAARSSRSRSARATCAASRSSATTRSSASREPRDGTFSGLALDENLRGEGRRGPLRAAGDRPQDGRRRALAARRGRGRGAVRRGRAARRRAADGARLQDRRDPLHGDDRGRAHALARRRDRARRPPRDREAGRAPVRESVARARRRGQVALALATATRLVRACAPIRRPATRCWAPCTSSAATSPPPSPPIARARDLAPDDPAVHNNLGLALREAGDAAASVAALQEAVRLRPSYWVAHNNLGLSLQATGELPKVLSPASARRSIAKPDYGRARHNLGNALRRARRARGRHGAAARGGAPGSALRRGVEQPGRRAPRGRRARRTRRTRCGARCTSARAIRRRS